LDNIDLKSLSFNSPTEGFTPDSSVLEHSQWHQQIGLLASLFSQTAKNGFHPAQQRAHQNAEELQYSASLLTYCSSSTK
jgi:hypothetical protein